ncbi:unnamed protein product [Pedinophyceae sp. YPF-701]|nr:unnamed protein product [Pedinophyceae sp. YPF-701]
MNVLAGLWMGGMGSRTGSLAHIAEYRKAESTNSLQNASSAVDCNTGSLLEYETLELRISPPNVSIDTETDPCSTVITVDSANRPGTLIELVQHFTMLGLNVKSAKISSDGGWFVDVFHLTDAEGNKVTDERKLSSISRMLNIRAAAAEAAEAKGSPGATATVFEAAGPDVPGMLSDLVQLLTSNGCDVRSVALWTYHGRCAMVISVTEGSQPILDPYRQEKLQQYMTDLIARKGLSAGGNSRPPVVRCANVHGEISHERRLHQLMLLEEGFEWQRGGGADSAAEASSAHGAPPPEAEDCTPVDVKPDVQITFSDRQNYWEVLVQCADRPKLLFDATCTLADLQMDIFHATVDTDGNDACLEYYVRPRMGDAGFDRAQADRLAAQLERAITRRFPKGLKLDVQACDRKELLPELLQQLKRAGLSVTRAKVVEGPGGSGAMLHRFYLMRDDGGFPSRQRIKEACMGVGGRMCSGEAETPTGSMTVGRRSGGAESVGAHSEAGSDAIASRLSADHVGGTPASASGGHQFSFQFGRRGSGVHRRMQSGASTADGTGHGRDAWSSALYSRSPAEGMAQLSLDGAAASGSVSRRGTRKVGGSCLRNASAIEAQDAGSQELAAAASMELPRVRVVTPAGAPLRAPETVTEEGAAKEGGES